MAKKTMVVEEAAVDDVFNRLQEAHVQNVQLRAALKELLDLDARRPVDTTWWARHWDDARTRAAALLEPPARKGGAK